MESPTNKTNLETEIIKILKDTYDPEIPVNIFDLGLIYNISVDGQNNVVLTMTLTAPNCPVADILPNEINEKIKKLQEVSVVKINVVFDPPWDQSMMSDEARFDLGMM